MSANDRAYMSAPRPRAVSNRVDAEVRGASPIQIENKNPLRNSSASQNHRVSRDQKSMSEKRTERAVITTREKSVRRNPVKESTSAPNRSDWDKVRPKKPAQTDSANIHTRNDEKDPSER
jgi:gamma-tubulin complex component 2